MPRVLDTPGEYPPDWPEINARVCVEVGHRCIRCGHPYTKGAHGAGEWSPCDDRCTHSGPHGFEYPDGQVIPVTVDLPTKGLLDVARSAEAGPKCVVAQWRILTVHHFDGRKDNCVWWNLLALCQRCHLHTQARVNPQQPYMLEHSDWLKPYVAGFYAHKYEGKQLTRAEVMLRLDELLAHERIA